MRRGAAAPAERHIRPSLPEELRVAHAARRPDRAANPTILSARRRRCRRRRGAGAARRADRWGAGRRRGGSCRAADSSQPAATSASGHRLMRVARVGMTVPTCGRTCRSVEAAAPRGAAAASPSCERTLPAQPCQPVDVPNDDCRAGLGSAGAVTPTLCARGIRQQFGPRLVGARVHPVQLARRRACPHRGRRRDPDRGDVVAAHPDRGAGSN